MTMAFSCLPLLELVFMPTARVENDLHITTRGWVGDDSDWPLPEDFVRRIYWRRRIILLCHGDRRRFGRKGEPSVTPNRSE